MLLIIIKYAQCLSLVRYIIKKTIYNNNVVGYIRNQGEFQTPRHLYSLMTWVTQEILKESYYTGTLLLKAGVDQY